MGEDKLEEVKGEHEERNRRKGQCATKRMVGRKEEKGGSRRRQNGREGGR